jgi:hypothetical protein
MTDRRAAFYVRHGSKTADLVSLLHLPYTLWHLSYVVIGAALAETLDGMILIGTFVAFAVGLGIGAHALDEVKSRPLATTLSDRTLWSLGLGAMAVSAGIAVVGAFVVSPGVALWGVAGVVLAVGYALEWPVLHTDPGFALAWGGFPVLVGYWAQTRSISAAVVVVAAAATLLSLVQRTLSTPARFVRRRTERAVVSFDGAPQWERADLLRTWETPLRLLAATAVALAIGLLLTHL